MFKITGTKTRISGEHATFLDLILPFKQIFWFTDFMQKYINLCFFIVVMIQFCSTISVSVFDGSRVLELSKIR